MNKTISVIAMIIGGAGCFFAGRLTKTVTKENCPPEICKNMTGVPLPVFKKVVNLYGVNRWNVCSRMLQRERQVAGQDFEGVEDARYIWFPLDSLDAFLCNIKYYSKQLDISSDQLGVRMYYAMYDNTHGEKSGLHTLFMTPTYLKNDVEAVDFDPRYTVNKNGSKNDLWTMLRIANTPHIDLPMLIFGQPNPDQQNIPLIRNSGDLCPPPRDCNAAMFNYIDN